MVYQSMSQFVAAVLGGKIPVDATVAVDSNSTYFYARSPSDEVYREEDILFAFKGSEKEFIEDFFEEIGMNVWD